MLTYQRQQSNEHMRLAYEILDVEFAADLTSPVSLWTRIHSEVQVELHDQGKH